MADNSCELCGYRGAMGEFYPEQRIVQCPSCSLVFYNAAVDTNLLYGPDYFHGREYFDYVTDKDILQRNFRKRIELLQKFVPPAGRMLEIGSAYGFFLDLARHHWNVQGLDVSIDAVRYARETLGLDVANAEFLDLADERESCDAICLWDTIEHLPHPVRVIEKAARWLKPGGVLALSTGDIGSLVARIRKDRWRQIHPPTHLYYFSRATLTRAVERTGLERAALVSEGVYRSYRSIAYSVFSLRSKSRDWIYRAITLGERLDFPIYLNLYDLLVLVARKPWA